MRGIIRGTFDVVKHVTVEISKEVPRSIIETGKEILKSAGESHPNFWEWHDSGFKIPKFHEVGQSRTLEEEYVHNVNVLGGMGQDISGIYDHRNYVECSAAMFEALHGTEDERKANEPKFVEIGATILSGFAIVVLMCNVGII